MLLRCGLVPLLSVSLLGCADAGRAPESQATDAADPITATVKTEDVQVAGSRVAERKLTVGKRLTVEGPSPSTPFVTVFEDDGDTGYFYALDTTKSDNPILDAIHIYNVSNVSDKDKPSKVEVVWSNDGLKSALLINEYPHAVFDFEARRGYCRTGFPPADRKWSRYSHEWDDSAVDLFRE